LHTAPLMNHNIMKLNLM